MIRYKEIQTLLNMLFKESDIISVLQEEENKLMED